ncbi:MAG TPA: hypothetical protein VE693_00310 [Gaiellaceae bacterium]|nr:hypothetical protein [Gaiellaceae bacterium]
MQVRPTPATLVSSALEVDFDIHGLAGVRLVDPSPADAAAVIRQLGPMRAALDREPDIVIRFVDRLETTSPMRFLGADEAGFTDDAFLILRGKHKSSAKVKIDFSEIGAQTEIVCERGLTAVPLLIPILTLTLLARGVLPLHASAFVHRGLGVVATGWSKGGKTEALLAFAARGAEYIGDEWVFVSSDGRRVFGLPEPIRLWNWHVRQLSEYPNLLGTRDRARLRAIEFALSRERALRRLAGGRVPALLRRQLHVDVDPVRLFGRLGRLDASFDRLFLLVSHDTRELRVEPIDPLEVARRMVFSLQYESLDFGAAYLKFRFAFPDAWNPFLAKVDEVRGETLERVLAGKPAYVVQHPYPCSFSALFEAMSKYC